MSTEGVPSFLDRTRLVGSYSLVNAYKNCPHQMMHRYIEKDIPFVETKEMRYGNEVHTALELRVRSKKPLPPAMQQWEQFCVPFDSAPAKLVEQKLGVTWNMRPCEFFDKEVYFRGKIDLAVINDTRAHIVDWKTGNSKYEDPLELAIGAVLLKAKWSALTRVTGSYVWLKENRVGEVYDLSDMQKTWLGMKRVMDDIEARKKSGQWDKVKSGLCGYCSVKDCEHWYEARK